ncbi:MAG: hypothetical protein EA344_05170 [Alkalicoccus sp.]|nr:MAG: hypothetical protein EA344_05170 [Alkalicoccus sp.]
MFAVAGEKLRFGLPWRRFSGRLRPAGSSNLLRHGPVFASFFHEHYSFFRKTGARAEPQATFKNNTELEQSLEESGHPFYQH